MEIFQENFENSKTILTVLESMNFTSPEYATSALSAHANNMLVINVFVQEGNFSHSKSLSTSMHN